MAAPPIPEWLQREVNEYFAVPLNINPATVLDIGANIGAFALRAHAQWPAARVICCEPMPFNLAQLTQNVEPHWCQLIPGAVRAYSGKADIYVGDMFVTGGFIKGQRQTDRTISVNCIAADRLPPCELVKVDTEGCEVEILQHLDLSQTQAVMLEHHSLSDAATLKQMLAAKGFNIVHDESEREIGTMIFVRA